MAESSEIETRLEEIVVEDGCRSSRAGVASLECRDPESRARRDRASGGPIGNRLGESLEMCTYAPFRDVT